jgi:hypothetical protein
MDHLDGVLYLDKALPETISWLMEDVDEEGNEIIVLEETTPEAIKAAYKARRFPPHTHVQDMLRERVERGR